MVKARRVSEPEQPEPGPEEKPVESPPEGSMCAEHPERPALATCPRCGSFACLGCWHHGVRRCHACLMRDPASAAPPIPWEDPSWNVVARWFRTLATALRPNASAPAFARSDAKTPLSFWATTFVPLAMLMGVIPYTRTLLVGPSFAYIWIDSPDAATIAIDVLSAVGLGLLVSLATITALTMPFVSLVRANAPTRGTRPRRCACSRTVGSCSLLSTLAIHVVGWGLPQHPNEIAQTVIGLIAVAPLALLFTALRSTARMASGVGPLASLATAIVPFVVMLLVQGLLEGAIAPWMPDPEMTRQLAERAGWL